MADFKLVSWIVGARIRVRNKRKKQGPQLGIFNHGRQGNQRQEDLKLGWYYWKFGRLSGPFSDAEILSLFDKGDLQEDSLVTLMNIPLAMLLKDPAKRLDAHTMLHLARPGLESAAMANQPAHSNVTSGEPTTWLLPKSTDAKKITEDCVAVHAESESDGEKACGPVLDVGRVGNANVPNGKPTTWLFPNSAGAKRLAADWAGAKSDEGDDKVCGQIFEVDRVGNGNCSKKISTFKTGPRDAVAPSSTSEASRSEVTSEREASEVDDKAKVEALETDKSTWRKNKAKVIASTAATLPTKTAARGVDRSEPQPAKNKSERKRPSKHPRDLLQNRSFDRKPVAISP